MRATLLLFTSAACAATGPEFTTATSDMTIMISRDEASAQPAVFVNIINKSKVPICISLDALQNPYSYEMHLKMRTSSGRPVRYNDPGYIPEPVTGIVRLEPGSSAKGRAYIYPRFKLRNRGRPIPLGMMIQASFPYNHCDIPLRIQANSSWQPI
jgi:hypothetical protein